MQKLIVALTLLFGGIAANDRDGHSRLLRGKTVDQETDRTRVELFRSFPGDHTPKPLPGERASTWQTPPSLEALSLPRVRS